VCSTAIFGTGSNRVLAANYDYSLGHGLIATNLRETCKENGHCLNSSTANRGQQQILKCRSSPTRIVEGSSPVVNLPAEAQHQLVDVVDATYRSRRIKITDASQPRNNS